MAKQQQRNLLNVELPGELKHIIRPEERKSTESTKVTASEPAPEKVAHEESNHTNKAEGTTEQSEREENRVPKRLSMVAQCRNVEGLFCKCLVS